MDTETIKVVAQVAGIGGIALGVFLVLFKEIIRKNIFPQLGKAQSFQLLRLMAVLVWSVAVTGIGAWVWVETRSDRDLASAAPERPDINGTWQANVSYDWPNADYLETFNFRGTGDQLLGSASFLSRARGIVEGTVKGAVLDFVTSTPSVAGSDRRETTHRYFGELEGNQIHFTMQTSGDFSDHIPVEFVARRLSDN